MAVTAAGVRRAGSPGPRPTTASSPGGTARRATATVESPVALTCLVVNRVAAGPAASRAAASATDGVPTALATTPLGFGTATAARAAAGKVRTGTPRRSP